MRNNFILNTKMDSSFTCEKCGSRAVDVSLICQDCGWDHFFGEYFPGPEKDEENDIPYEEED